MEDKKRIYVQDSKKNCNINKSENLVWKWIISILCIISGITFLQDIIGPAILISLAGIILLPPVDKIIKEKLVETNKIKMFKILRTIYVIFAIIVVSNNIPNSLNNQDVCSITESLNVLQVQNTVELKQNTISENSANTVNTENGRYHGEFVNGKMQGKGTYEWKDGSKYVGEFESNKLNGKGTLIIPGKGSYEGNFKNGKKNGQGTYKFANGDVYVGNWIDDKMSGQGSYTFSNGEKYVGEFKDNKFNGQGIYSKNGKNYIGTWKDNKYSK